MEEKINKSSETRFNDISGMTINRNPRPEKQTKKELYEEMRRKLQEAIENEEKKKSR